MGRHFMIYNLKESYLASDSALAGIFQGEYLLDAGSSSLCEIWAFLVRMRPLNLCSENQYGSHRKLLADFPFKRPSWVSAWLDMPIKLGHISAKIRIQRSHQILRIRPQRVDIFFDCQRYEYGLSA